MLRFADNQVELVTDNPPKHWSFSQFLESYNPLGTIDLSIQNQLYQEVVAHAEEYYSELSEKARWQYDFWKNIRLTRLPSHTFAYTYQSVSQVHSWEVTLNETGLFYKDLSGIYKDPTREIPQLISDFWFHGPAWPMPDPDIRKTLVSFIRNAFLQVGGKAYDHPFPVFEYPKLANPLHWKQGDYRVSSYVTMLPYGIDFGDQNFHDGLVFRGFLSFENCYTNPDAFAHMIDPSILSQINTYTAACLQGKPQSLTSPANSSPVDSKERSRQLYMDNGGQTHYIYLDGFGDEYHASAADEAQWKQELIESYRQRLLVEDNESTAEFLLRTLLHHQAIGMEDLLITRARQAPLKDRQWIGQMLWKHFKSDYSTTLLIDFLKDNGLDTYWHDYAWTTLSRMKESRPTQAWVMECLQGSNPHFFRKSMDVLLVWSIGHPALAGLLASGKLGQENKALPDQYQLTLEKLQQLLQAPEVSSN